ncbi:MAG: hypothetical protein HYU52_16555 [Acidobacteria bacterium]|nr:hypothetical protein [Acidobacteriota bacterium]
MKPTRFLLAALLILLAFVSCASRVDYVYPQVEGSWMYDYAASINDTGEVPSIPQEWLSELKQDADPTRDRLMVLRNPPEILYIERVGGQLHIQGGGRFERTYKLDGSAPSPTSTLTLNESSIIAVHREAEMTLTETWRVSPERTTLFVAIRVETPKLKAPLDIVRIYRSSKAF